MPGIFDFFTKARKNIEKRKKENEGSENAGDAAIILQFAKKKKKLAGKIEESGLKKRKVVGRDGKLK